jgi:tripartite-type tricarboxylate transporter receptor subunit TctC
MPQIQQRLNDLVVEVAPTHPQEFAQFMRAETARWARVIKAANIPQE